MAELLSGTVQIIVTVFLMVMLALAGVAVINLRG